MVLLFYGKINILARRKIKWAFYLGMAETICWQFWVHGKGKVSSSSKYRNVRRKEDGCLKYAAIPRSLVILASSWWIFRLVEGEMMRCSNFTLTTTQYYSAEKTKNSSLENISWNHINQYYLFLISRFFCEKNCKSRILKFPHCGWIAASTFFIFLLTFCRRNRVKGVGSSEMMGEKLDVT